MIDLFEDVIEDRREVKTTETHVPQLVLVDEYKDEGGHYLDKFTATYADLVIVLGEPNGNASSDGKVNIEWKIIYKGHHGYIYDWKGAESPKSDPYENYSWHIGGKNNMWLWTSDLIDDIHSAINSTADKVEESVQPIKTVAKLREWMDNSKQDVRHLVEQYYYEDLYNLTKDQLCDWLVEHKEELEEDISDDIDIDIQAIRDEEDIPVESTRLAFDNFYLEGGLTGVLNIQEEVLDDTFGDSQGQTMYNVECSADYIGDCDMYKETEDDDMIWGGEIKISCKYVSFSVPKNSAVISGDLVDLEALTEVVEQAIETGRVETVITDEPFSKYPKFTLILDVKSPLVQDADELYNANCDIVVDNPQEVDDFVASETYEDKDVDFNVICDNGDHLTVKTFEEALENAKNMDNVFKIEKVTYGVRDGERELIKEEDVWAPGEGTVVPEKTIYEQLLELD